MIETTENSKDDDQTFKKYSQKKLPFNLHDI